MEEVGWWDDEVEERVERVKGAAAGPTKWKRASLALSLRRAEGVRMRVLVWLRCSSDQAQEAF